MYGKNQSELYLVVWGIPEKMVHNVTSMERTPPFSAVHNVTFECQGWKAGFMLLLLVSDMNLCTLQCLEDAWARWTIIQ